jgi:hypothetical protein
MKGKTKEDIVEYFEKKVIPLIEDRYPEVASEMNIRIDDLFFGSPEECSNPDATVFLEDRLWAAKGGHWRCQRKSKASLEPDTVLGFGFTRSPGFES